MGVNPKLVCGIILYGLGATTTNRDVLDGTVGSSILQAEDYVSISMSWKFILLEAVLFIFNSLNK